MSLSAKGREGEGGEGGEGGGELRQSDRRSPPQRREKRVVISSGLVI